MFEYVTAVIHCIYPALERISDQPSRLYTGHVLCPETVTISVSGLFPYSGDFTPVNLGSLICNPLFGCSAYVYIADLTN